MLNSNSNYNINSFRTLMSRFNGVKILVLGDILVDEYWHVTASAISPEAPIPLVEIVSKHHKVGGAAGIAVVVKTLGGDAKLIGLVGNDDCGRHIKEQLNCEGLANNILVDDNYLTPSFCRIIADSQHLLRIDNKKQFTNYSCADRVIELLNQEKDIVAIAVQDYGLQTASQKLMDKLQSLGLPFILNSDLKFIYDLHGAGILRTNYKRVENMLGVKVVNESSLRNAINKIISTFNCESVLLTLGKDGAILKEKQEDFLNIPATNNKLLDKSGVGEIMTAVIALSLGAGASLKEAAILSNYAAGAKIEKIGSTIVTRSEIENNISAHIHSTF